MPLCDSSNGDDLSAICPQCGKKNKLNRESSTFECWNCFSVVNVNDKRQDEKTRKDNDVHI